MCSTPSRPSFWLVLLLLLGAPIVVGAQEVADVHAEHENRPCGDCYEAVLAEFVDEFGEPTGVVLGEHTFNPDCATIEEPEGCPIEGQIEGPIYRSCDGEGTDNTCHNGAVSGTCDDSHYDPPCQQVAAALDDLSDALKVSDAIAVRRAAERHGSLRSTETGVEITECDGETLRIALSADLRSVETGDR